MRETTSAIKKCIHTFSNSFLKTGTLPGTGHQKRGLPPENEDGWSQFHTCHHVYFLKQSCTWFSRQISQHLWSYPLEPITSVVSSWVPPVYFKSHSVIWIIHFPDFQTLKHFVLARWSNNPEECWTKHRPVRCAYTLCYFHLSSS